MIELTYEQICEIARSTKTAEPGIDGYILPVAFARAVIAADRELQDARLIAAAPDLLAALRVLVENGGLGPESMFHDARDAIAKATGEDT